ncbi:putative AdoMet-dependent methyltransferase [Clostridium acetobutylicum]|uniref:SoxR family transcriptional regulator fused to SAM-dependent methyltransferase n=1 Tax=Clostridium acetobutylicum (strain ATCC 824 / DSM 792 / JCM 1419 / IAM 19013 / LMG 5710 / NBRC 13948 / NRRL B-527 / VKM B-1787 / 2291 / W) TaxID=272562 RepID=Q97GB8_CLOAB|nr:MerR family transcriptional regulator [Clostridium acetobutylicum]PSM07137.1 MerR family transcriptional regulator [Clostridium sp. NJ4]AAK80405.1 SoxR family transcriptional regulator fused to SAM-dependent methyltransferase [Clostridium acetobutylicum ATCC 824]ADZ21502.1 SoxR family transcriptional regulator fused to SAM-dependent methyltransferase [Clostridium acetobutylicum EA 2018]AEI32349.1 SoxR family transcriptional regulator [Clostridium acetobutylicum DSM 1731]AWV79177.1 methyltra
MNTKKVCEKLKISPKALRLYEELNIIVPNRDENNYRNYSEDDLFKLRQVVVLKSIGIKLKSIKDILDKRKYEDNKVVNILYMQLKAVENRILELKKIEEVLREGINTGLNNDISYEKLFDKIDECVYESEKNINSWIDKWEFDTWAKNYDDYVYNNKDSLGLFESYDLVLENVAKKIKGMNAKKVIDFGCGTANIVKKLSSSIEYTGVDQSIEMLIRARTKNKAINLRIGNFLDKPFAEEEFDAVISSFAFHHLNCYEKKRAIRYLLKYIKKNGKVIIADLMFLSKEEKMKKRQQFIDNEEKDKWDTIEDEYYTDIESLKAYIEDSGLKIKFEHIVNYTFIVEITA